MMMTNAPRNADAPVTPSKPEQKPDASPPATPQKPGKDAPSPFDPAPATKPTGPCINPDGDYDACVLPPRIFATLAGRAHSISSREA